MLEVREVLPLLQPKHCLNCMRSFSAMTSAGAVVYHNDLKHYEMSYEENTVVPRKINHEETSYEECTCHGPFLSLVLHF